MSANKACVHCLRRCWTAWLSTKNVSRTLLLPRCWVTSSLPSTASSSVSMPGGTFGLHVCRLQTKRWHAISCWLAFMHTTERSSTRHGFLVSHLPPASTSHSFPLLHVAVTHHISVRKFSICEELHTLHFIRYLKKKMLVTRAVQPVFF